MERDGGPSASCLRALADTYTPPSGPGATSTWLAVASGRTPAATGGIVMSGSSKDARANDGSGTLVGLPEVVAAADSERSGETPGVESGLVIVPRSERTR